MPRATGPTYNVPFRRRRERTTNYAKRLALVKSGKPRMVVRKTLNRVIVEFVEFAEIGDKVLARADSDELKQFGWVGRGNLPSAYLTGMLAAKKAAKNNVSDFVLDMGLAVASKNALPFAAAKGAVDAGLKGAVGEGKIDDSRIRGEHIAKYAEEAKKSGKYDKLFSMYIKEGVKPEKLPEMFDAAKAKIGKG